MLLERILALAVQGVGIDTETHLIQKGLLAPPLVCGSAGWMDGPELTAALLAKGDVIELFAQALEDPNTTLVGANVAFDLLVLARELALLGIDAMPAIFAALDEGRVYDVQIAEALHAVAQGHLGKDPRTQGPLVNPETGKRGRYSLATCVDLVLGRKDAKANDEWRSRYAELEALPMHAWPPAARDYPVDDARNTIEVALAQAGHLPQIAARHNWGVVNGASVCTECGASKFSTHCQTRRMHRNLHDLAAQVGTAFAMHAGAAWGFPVDQSLVDIIERHALRNKERGVKPFVEAGLVRDDGSENRSELKRRVAIAYGAKDPCPVCSGTGKVISPRAPLVRCTACRGVGIEHVSGMAVTCRTCRGEKKIKSPRALINCAHFDAEGNASKTCDGTGLVVPEDVPRSEKEGIAYGRDVLHESGDEFLMAYGDYQEDAKDLNVYIPYLREARTQDPITGAWRDIPLTLRPNVLLETGRTSYDGVIQLFKRKPGHVDRETGEYVPSLRECIGSRRSTVLSSEDFLAGELITHGQSCIWLVGYSDLASALLRGVDPHSALAASVLGVTYDEFLKRKKERKFKDARQASKCFHPDTEVLTRRGWVRVGDVTYEDEITAAIPEEGGIRLEWQHPTALTRRPSPGHLTHLKNEGMDLRVTDDHRMLVRGGTGRWKVVAPADVGRAREWYNAGDLDGGSWAVDERVLRLAVATQADGTYCYDQIRFGFVKQRKIDRLRSLLRDGEFEERESPADTSTGKVTWFTLRPGLARRVRELLDERKQFTWRWLELSPALRRVVLEEAAHWDGCQQPNWRHYQFSSTQKQSVDVLQAIATLTGRKTRAVNVGRDQAHHRDVWKLSVRAKPNTRGENLRAERVAYDGDVVCLSVPASFVVARDGGVPVVVGQCFNFGKPGGMGDVKLVLQQRKQGPDTPCPGGPALVDDGSGKGNLVPGYKGLRFCILMDGATSCGTRKRTMYRDKRIPPTCEHCIECAARLGDYWKRQWSENQRYFNLISVFVDDGMVITGEALDRWPHLKPWFRPGQQLAPGEIMQHVSGRIRGGTDFCSAANGFFQGLLADIAKSALRRVSRECYDRTVRVPDMVHPNSIRSEFAGAESPLYGSRVIVFQHDELIAEHPESIAHEAATRISEIMRDEMRWYCPDLADAAKAEPTLMRRWYKGAECVRDASGRLVPWEPKKAV